MSFRPGTRKGLHVKTKTAPSKNSAVPQDYDEDPMEFEEGVVPSCMKRLPHDSLSALSNTWDPKGAQTACVPAARKARRA